jgi:hypothetical protein
MCARAPARHSLKCISNGMDYSAEGLEALVGVCRALVTHEAELSGRAEIAEAAWEAARDAFNAAVPFYPKEQNYALVETGEVSVRVAFARRLAPTLGQVGSCSETEMKAAATALEDAATAFVGTRSAQTTLFHDARAAATPYVGACAFEGCASEPEAWNDKEARLRCVLAARTDAESDELVALRCLRALVLCPRGAAACADVATARGKACGSAFTHDTEGRRGRKELLLQRCHGDACPRLLCTCCSTCAEGPLNHMCAECELAYSVAEFTQQLRAHPVLGEEGDGADLAGSLRAGAQIELETMRITLHEFARTRGFALLPPMAYSALEMPHFMMESYAALWDLQAATGCPLPAARLVGAPVCRCEEGGEQHWYVVLFLRDAVADGSARILLVGGARSAGAPYMEALVNRALRAPLRALAIARHESEYAECLKGARTVYFHNETTEKVLHAGAADNNCGALAWALIALAHNYHVTSNDWDAGGLVAGVTDNMLQTRGAMASVCLTPGALVAFAALDEARASHPYTPIDALQAYHEAGFEGDGERIDTKKRKAAVVAAASAATDDGTSSDDDDADDADTDASAAKSPASKKARKALPPCKTCAQRHGPLKRPRNSCAVLFALRHAGPLIRAGGCDAPAAVDAAFEELRDDAERHSCVFAESELRRLFEELLNGAYFARPRADMLRVVAAQGAAEAAEGARACDICGLLTLPTLAGVHARSPACFMRCFAVARCQETPVDLARYEAELSKLLHEFGAAAPPPAAEEAAQTIALEGDDDETDLRALLRQLRTEQLQGQEAMAARMAALETAMVQLRESMAASFAAMAAAARDRRPRALFGGAPPAAAGGILQQAKADAYLTGSPMSARARVLPADAMGDDSSL